MEEICKNDKAERNYRIFMSREELHKALNALLV